MKLSKKGKKPEREKNTKMLESINANESENSSPHKPEHRRKKHLYHNQENIEQKEHKVINSLVGNLSHALEEDVKDIDEILPDEGSAKEYHDREKRPAKYRFFLIIGLLVFWLAIIGVLDVFNSFREFAYNVSNQTALKEEFEKFLFPVVMNDPPEFTDIENIQSSTVVASAIWQIIFTGDTSNYEKSMNLMTIPAADVEAAARGIFGTGFKINHRTIDFITIAFDYEDEKKSYTVPENPLYFTYSPQITSLSKTGDIYRVKVAYFMPTPQLLAGIDYENEPVKTMIYTILRTKDKSKTIQSIEFNREEESIG